jgi:hypothetical protein
VVAVRAGRGAAEEARDGPEGERDDGGDSATYRTEYISDGLEHDGSSF